MPHAPIKPLPLEFIHETMAPTLNGSLATHLQYHRRAEDQDLSAHPTSKDEYLG